MKFYKIIHPKTVGAAITVGIMNHGGITVGLNNQPQYFIGRRDRNYHNRYFEINIWRFRVVFRWELNIPYHNCYINGAYYNHEVDKVNMTVKLVPATPGEELIYYSDYYKSLNKRGTK